VVSPVEFLRWLANVWSLGVLVVIAGTLLWFVYWVFLRRLWRAKHIANIRLRRMMESREDSEGESGVP
jgi:drug/metabolite transporter (DMT)-like permease